MLLNQLLILNQWNQRILEFGLGLTQPYKTGLNERSLLVIINSFSGFISSNMGLLTPPLPKTVHQNNDPHGSIADRLMELG